MKARGIDLTGHISQPLTDQLARHADLVLVMTSGHRKAIVSQWPELESRTHLFSPAGRDIGDPVGQSNDVYTRCAEELDTYAAHWARVIVSQASPE